MGKNSQAKAINDLVCPKLRYCREIKEVEVIHSATCRKHRGTKSLCTFLWDHMRNYKSLVTNSKIYTIRQFTKVDI